MRTMSASTTTPRGEQPGCFSPACSTGEGTVIVLCHSGIYQVHRDRVRGFSEYFLEHPSNALTFKRVLFGHDDSKRCSALLSEALADYPDLVGLYNAGGGNASLSAVLRMSARGREIFFVGHELTERSAAALREGVMSVVIDQSPEAQARRAMDLILFQLGMQTEKVENPPIRFITITPENI